MQADKDQCSYCNTHDKVQEEECWEYPLFVDPPDDAYTPYFKEFEGKRAPNFTAVEDHVLCKAYAAVSEDPAAGTDQTA